MSAFDVNRRTILKAGAALAAAGTLSPVSAFAKSETPVRIGHIEALTGTSVYLGLLVKVLPKWRRSAAALTRFGFSV